MAAVSVYIGEDGVHAGGCLHDEVEFSVVVEPISAGWRCSKRTVPVARSVMRRTEEHLGTLPDVASSGDRMATKLCRRV